MPNAPRVQVNLTLDPEFAAALEAAAAAKGTTATQLARDIVRAHMPKALRKAASKRKASKRGAK